MALVQRKLTFHDYSAMQTLPGTQLIHGELVTTSATFRHQAIVARLLVAIVNWVEAAAGRGQAGMSCNWVLADDLVVEPDVWWLDAPRVPRGDTLWFHGPPDLAVEVRSAGTWRFDIGAKKQGYGVAGTRELWLVDTAADVVVVYRHADGQPDGWDDGLEFSRADQLTTPLLPGLGIDLATLFGAS